MLAADPFWADPLHRQLREMLVAQEHRNVTADPWWRQREFVAHRQLYTVAASLLAQPQPSAVVDIWRCGLSWYLWRFGLPADSATLTTAVARRVRAAQVGLTKPEAPSFPVAVDQLVGQAAQGLFDTAAALLVARWTGLNLAMLHRQLVDTAEPLPPRPKPQVAR